MALGMSVPKRVFFIVVLVAIVASLVIMGEFYRTGAISFRPLSKVQDHVGIQLFFADYIGKQVQGIDGALWNGCAESTIQTNEGRTDVYPSLQFWLPGQFNGGQLVFKEVKTPTETANAALTWQTNTPLFQYSVLFESGLQSKLDNNNVLEDLRDRKLNMMGTTFTFLSGQNTYNPGTNRIQLRLLGGYGTIDLTDICDNTFTDGGVRVNGKTVDAQLNIICTQIQDLIRIESIDYRPEATPVSAMGDFDVLPRHGISEYMLYPEALLTPEFNLFFAQLGSGGGAGPSPTPSGGGDIVFDGTRKQYRGEFSLNGGGSYQVDLVRYQPFSWGSDSGNRNFVTKESNWIFSQDYFGLSSGTGLNDRSWIYMFNKIDKTNNKVYWRDMSGGGNKEAYFDPVTGDGQMNIGGYNFAFQVDAANNRMKVDLNNDGAIAASTVELITSGRLRMKFGPGVGDIEIIVPWQLREEQPTDEVNKVKIFKSGNRLASEVLSPTMQDDPSVEGREQGMSQFGLRFVWDSIDTPETINIFTGGGQQAAPQVSVTPGGQVAGIILITDKQSELAAMQS